ncbi:hypothetical protein [Pseudanabaena sp. FACHB-2040]|uniref:hypothetical protein n=1 Tax=Pseudanabaena sp. FACHB-2040 TaxID=2692859 RepID=UPI001683BF0F|nr:hypothetical protein [Pseudanabaena sp. FACHB-2040]MBD2255997.1 hypothetical protein [Pseudanabaena sp. FACHB-2040]
MPDDLPASSNTALASVESDHWAAAAILTLVENNIVSRDWASQHGLDAPVARDELLRVLEWGQHSALTMLSDDDPAPAVETAMLTRAEGIALLIDRLRYLKPLVPEPVLDIYFEDGDEVPADLRAALAAATLSGLVVSYPNVRRLQPQAPLDWATAAALLCQGLGFAVVPPQYVTWYARLDTLDQSAAIPFWRLRGNAYLVRDIQTQLQQVRLYPRDRKPDGRFSLDTQTALLEFCQVLQLPSGQTYTLDASLAKRLQTVDVVDFSLRVAKNRDRIFREYLKQEAGFDAAHLAFLDRGIQKSPFEKLVEEYPGYLRLKPSAPKTVQTPTTKTSSPRPYPRSALRRAAHLFTPLAAHAATPSASPTRPTFCPVPQPYPDRGVLPSIEEARLKFLHADIQQACLCLGQFVNQQLTTTWLGRSALANGELWSATKVLPLLHLISQVHSKAIQADIDQLVIRSGGRSTEFSIHDLAVDMVNYEYDISSSNALAAMFKLFTTPQTLEKWLRSITGNTQLVFRGNYGEGPFIGRPVLWDQQRQQVLLAASGVRHGGPNALSTYDMTRLMTMLGWHPHLLASAQLPRAQWKSLESVVRALGRDSARYVDAAIERLGLRPVMQSPVIISKMGFGYSSQRRRTELVYSAFVQFFDARPQAIEANGVAPLRSFGLTLLAAKRLGDNDREATLLDARLAAEVTEILRRILLDDWA